MWTSERKKAEEAAIRRYGTPLPEDQEVFVAEKWTSDHNNFTLAIRDGVILLKTQKDWVAIVYSNGQVLFVGTIQWIESQLRKMGAEILMKIEVPARKVSDVRS